MGAKREYRVLVHNLKSGNVGFDEFFTKGKALANRNIFGKGRKKI